MRKAQIPVLPREDCLTYKCWMSGFPVGSQHGFEIILCLSSVCVCVSASAPSRSTHTHVRRCWLHCLLPGVLKLPIHTLSHHRGHTTVILTYLCLRPAVWLHANVPVLHLKVKLTLWHIWSPLFQWVIKHSRNSALSQFKTVLQQTVRLDLRHTVKWWCIFHVGQQ